MNHSGHGRHGIPPMVIGCGAMLVALLLLPSLGASGAVAVVALVLLLCPLSMLVCARGERANGDAADAIQR